MTLCPVPLNCTDTYGTLTIGTVSMSGPGWCAYDLSVLGDSLDEKGDNVDVPWVGGSIPRGLLDAETPKTLPLMFSGAVDQDDTPYANPAGGLDANRQTVHDLLVAPIRDGTATSFVAVWTRPDPDDPDGTVDWTATVQPRALAGWQLEPGGYATADLELVQISPWEEDGE